ncbi:hypothetical protein BDV93DRAFT_548226 [Ceratobasidium sp. AG-I]|nr:hypothetical protein BDV93DRAFT_548226 [Ceratobasidium sp. AG-I]
MSFLEEPFTFSNLNASHVVVVGPGAKAMEPPPRNSNQATIKSPDIVMMSDVPDGFGSEWSCGGCASCRPTARSDSSLFRICMNRSIAVVLAYTPRISSGSSASSSRSRSPLAQLVAVGSPPFAARDTRSSASSLLQKQQQVDAPELARRAQRETDFSGYHVLMRV